MFIKDSFVDLLNELSGAQESIEKVSVWIQQYRDQAPIIAQAWKNFYLEASQEKKLTLLFLVNDVLQHSKRKGPQFVDAFGHILPKCMSECKNAESKSQIERMLDIWESREVFHKHIISAMKYNLDEIGMDESYVKLTDLMDSLDLLRGHEKKSSEVLTKLSHRLDTTDFANAFNVTSRKEGDKYAADFDETAHFLDQYCSCLLKQTEARSAMIKKINSTMFQMEKSEETIKTQDKDYKTQQGTLVRTRKAITSRLMLIDEGKVNFGDESPDREEIENLTSEEEDVDIEGIETVEYQKVKRLDRDGVLFAQFASFCFNIESNPIFQSILEQYNFCKKCCPVKWVCVVYLSIRVLLHSFFRKSQLFHIRDHGVSPKRCKSPLALLSKIRSSYDVDLMARSLPSVYHVFMMNGKYGPSLPRDNLNTSNPQNYGPRLPSNVNARMAGPPLPTPQQSAQKFGPSLPTSTPSSSEKLGPPLPVNQGTGGMFGPALPVSSHGPALPATLNSLVNNPNKFGPPLPIQSYPAFGPALPPAPVFSSFPADVAPAPPANDAKFGPPPPESVKKDKVTSKSEDNKYLPPVPENCHTTIERLTKLYNTDQQVLGSKTNLQDVFGGNARGFDPLEEDAEPKIISKSLDLSPKKEIPPEDPGPPTSNNPVSNVLEPILKAYIGSFEPPKFSSFPSDVVNAVIKGNPDKNDTKVSDQKDAYPEKTAHSPRHRHSPPPRHRQRTPPPHRTSPRQKSPYRQKSPHRQHSSSRQRSPRREKSPHRRRSPHRERRHSPHRRHSPSRGEKNFDRSRSDSGHGRPSDRDRAPDKHSPMFSPTGPQPIGGPMGPPLPTPNNMQQNRFGPPMPPNNMPMDRFGPPMPQSNARAGRFGPPVPPNNVQPDRFGPPMPPNNMQQNRFGPPVPPNNMPVGNMQGPNNFRPYQGPGNNFMPTMNQNFPQGPRMGGPGPMNNMMGQSGPPPQFNRGFSPPQRMMQSGPGPGHFGPRGM